MRLLAARSLNQSDGSGSELERGAGFDPFHTLGASARNTPICRRLSYRSISKQVGK